MSKLQNLIDKLCPDGVEYVEIKDICDINRGRIISKNYINSNFGEYPVYSSQTENKGILGTINTFDYFGEYITWTTDGANAGTVFYRKGKFSITNVCGLLNVISNKVLVRYLYFQLTILAPNYVNRGMGNPKLMSNVMGKIKIPLPPLEIQSEIVRILDNFTELTAELTARKKQYEYYREKLLTFGDEVERVELGEIGYQFFRGSGITRNQLKEKGIPCIRYGEIYTSYNIYFDKCFSYTYEDEIKNPKYIEKGDILFAITGESVEEIGKSCAYIGSERCLVGGDILVMKHNQNPKYISYALSAYDAIRQKTKGKIKSKVVHTNLQSISKIKIPLPPLEEQQKIVDILDRFDALCNDITKGLPAEIEARQKQYEYYRDKLLTFKEK